MGSAVHRTRAAALRASSDGDQCPWPERAGPADHRGIDQEHPLELILARNLVSIIALPALLVDVEGRIVFFNEAAAEVVGSPFEELGSLTRREWNARFGPIGADGSPLTADELPLALAVREGRPAHARLRVRGTSGPLEVEVGALPLLGPAGYHGAMIFFWIAAALDDRSV